MLKPPPFDRATVEVIQTIEVPDRGLSVVIARFPSEFSLRPFKVYQIDAATGEARWLADFTCEASALHGFAYWLRRIRDEPV